MSDDAGAIMVERTVRFCVHSSANRANAGRGNSFAGMPSMVGLGAHYEITVACRGQPDPATGYLLNITAIDRAVRTHVVPLIQRAYAARPQPAVERVMGEVRAAMRGQFGDLVHRVRWRLAPYYFVAMSAAVPDRVSITQSFEFAAAHRLHVDALSDAANREVFGKCNNPSGHGHNYRVEVTAVTPVDGGGFTLHAMEDIVGRVIIDRFDHKHLNRDTAEFARVNPSVENIARVCHNLLKEPVAEAGGSLERVTVWETEKTCCTYPA